MNNFRLKAIATLSGISLAACLIMQLYLGLFIEGDFVEIGRNLGVFLVVVCIIVVVADILLWRILSPLVAAQARLDSGENLDSGEKERVRVANTKIPVIILALCGLGFFVGPAISMTANSLSGHAQYSATKIAYLLALNVSIGLVVALQLILIFEDLLEVPMARLAIHDFPPGARKTSLRTRLVLNACASTLLASVLLAFAGWATASKAAASGQAPDAGAFALKTLVLILINLGWNFGLFFVLARSISRRLESIAGRMAGLASGEKSRGLLPLTYNDEIGSIASSLNKFFRQITELLAQVGSISGSVREGAIALTESASHADGALGELEKSLSLVSGSVERQSGIVGSTEGEISRMVESIDTVAARVADQASFVEQSSAAVSEMAANIASVSKTAERAAELSAKLSAASSEGGAALKASLESIREIEAASQSVKEILGVIAKIAAQTNLLAMNAAIEAAHAGDAGAGFAVVADEVRSLAESSSKSAKEIASLIKGMNQKIEKGAGLADNAGAAFGRISEGVAETGELVQTIAASMGEQSEGAKEILSSVSHLTEATHVIKELTGEQKAESKTMEEAMLNIVSASNEIFEAVQEETGATQSLGRVIALVSEEARKNREHVDGLEQAVSVFSVTK